MRLVNNQLTFERGDYVITWGYCNGELEPNNLAQVCGQLGVDIATHDDFSGGYHGTYVVTMNPSMPDNKYRATRASGDLRYITPEEVVLWTLQGAR